MSGHIVLIEPSGRGGIGHYTCQLAQGLSTAGAVVHVHTSSDWNLLPRPNYRVFRVFRPWGANPLTLLNAIWRERRQGMAVVHWQSATHARKLRMLQVAWRPKGVTRWVHTVHNVMPHDDEGADSQAQYRQLYAAADGLIFHAEASRKRFAELFPTLAGLPHATIPLGHFGFLAPWSEHALPLGERDPVILFFGSIRPYKGLMELLEAFALVRDRIPRARLAIVGRPYGSWEPYEETIRRLKLESSVTARLGYVPEAEVPTVLAQARLVCLPYREIDMSGVLLLAMAAGLPVVASNVGGIKEVLKDGETGCLTPPRDVEALAETLSGILDDPDRLSAMGQRAKQIAEREYSWERIASQTLRFYASLGADVPVPRL